MKPETGLVNTLQFSSCDELDNLEDDMELLRFPEEQYFMIGNFKRAEDSKSRNAIYPDLS